MSEIDETATRMGVAVLGGHTEVTPGLDRPIITGFMIGETGKRGAVSAAGGRVGDLVLLTKTAGIEGTAIIASDYSEKLRSLSALTLERAKAFSRNISVVREALALAVSKETHAMHDPTEGGVLNGLWELAEASDLGIDVWTDKVNVALETKQICSILRLDPLKLMSSGSLLVAVHPSAASRVMQRFRLMRVRASQVGVLTQKRKGRNVLRNGRKSTLRAVPRDELYRLA
jgi:hydrogenase maturation factor